MNVFLLYALLLKATLTSFSGLASLPMVRNDLVVERKMLTDRQLNTAVAAGRTAPGPNGLYLVSVGYYADGLPGAAAGLLAMLTPAFLVLPLVRWLGSRAESPRVRSAIRAVVLASAG
ncbi:MAG: chromate transporter, partial [Bryobacteraceae bacterium]